MICAHLQCAKFFVVGDPDVKRLVIRRRKSALRRCAKKLGLARLPTLSIISDGSQMFHIWLPSQRRFAANKWSNGLRRRLMSAIFGGSVVRLFIRFSRNRGLFRLIIHSLGLVNASRRLMKQSRQETIACAFSGGDSRPSGRFCRSGESKRRKDENHSRQGHGDSLPSGINRQTLEFL